MPNTPAAYYSINSFNHLPPKENDLFTKLIKKELEPFYDSGVLLKPVAYKARLHKIRVTGINTYISIGVNEGCPKSAIESYRPRINGHYFVVDFLFNIPAGFNLEHFKMGSFGPCSSNVSFNLYMPERFFGFNLMLNITDSKNIYVTNTVLNHGFLSLRSSNEKIKRYTSTVPIANHYGHGVCAGYANVAPGTSIFDQIASHYLSFVNSYHNYDHLVENLANSRYAYLMFKYIPEMEHAFDMPKIQQFVSKAKQSLCFDEWIQTIHDIYSKLGYIRPEDGLHNYANKWHYGVDVLRFLEIWQENPDFLSKVPAKEKFASKQVTPVYCAIPELLESKFSKLN